MARRNNLWIFTVVVLTILMLLGCEKVQKPKPMPEDGGDSAALITTLRAAGLGIEPVREVEQPFISVQGKLFKVDGQDMQVFEYETEADAAEESNKIVVMVAEILGGGDTIPITWINESYFYQKGRLVVLYFGNDDRTRKALTAALDIPISGPELPSKPSGKPPAALPVNSQGCQSDADCMTAGCSDQLCVPKTAGDIMTTCEWKESYSCYQDKSQCGCVEGTCGWSKQVQECLNTFEVEP